MGMSCERRESLWWGSGLQWIGSFSLIYKAILSWTYATSVVFVFRVLCPRAERAVHFATFFEIDVVTSKVVSETFFLCKVVSVLCELKLIGALASRNVWRRKYVIFVRTASNFCFKLSDKYWSNAFPYPHRQPRKHKTLIWWNAPPNKFTKGRA